MRNAYWVLLSFLSASAITCLGCSGGEEPAAPAQGKDSKAASADTAQADSGTSKTEPAKSAKPQIKQIDLKDLPPTKGLSPPVDDGRLQVPILADWSVPPRSTQWVFRLQRDKKAAYPQIFVTVDAEAAADAEQLTKKNVAAFAADWQKQMEKKVDPNSFGEQATPIQLGDKYAAECVIYAASAKTKQEQLFIKRIENGRIYTLELRALRGTLEGYRTGLYAMAAGLKASAPLESSGESGFGDFSEGGLDAPEKTPAEKTTPE